MKRAVWIVTFLWIGMMLNNNISCSGFQECFYEQPLMVLMWLFVIWYFVYQVWKRIWKSLDNNEVIKEAEKKDKVEEIKTKKTKKQ